MKYQINMENGIANRGNLDRLKKLMKRAEAGEKITLGFLGGSITQGCLSSTPELCYAYRVYEWWCKTFPDAEFTYLNAGIGSTTSQLGVARADKDLLSEKPDFVITEFSVNDEPNDHFLETYEGLIRKVYGDETAPAVLIVHNVFYHNGGNSQLYHSRIGRHYQIPCVSMQSSIYPEVVAGKIPNRDITSDDLHPNDEGHDLVAGVITYFLGKVHDEVNVPESPAPELIAPITPNTYENSARYQNYNCEPVCDGFIKDTSKQNGVADCFKNGWTASEQGAKITFEIEAKGISVQYRKSVKQPAPIAEVVIDGDKSNAVELDANFDETWGDMIQLDTITEHGELKKHKVEITLTKTHEDDAVPFYLVSVLGAK